MKNTLLPFLDTGEFIPVYDVLKQPVSFHIPIHRAFSKFLIETIKLFPNANLSELLDWERFGDEFKGCRSLLMEIPLQIQGISIFGLLCKLITSLLQNILAQ